MKFNLTVDTKDTINLIKDNKCLLLNNENQTKLTQNVLNDFYTCFVNGERFAKTINIKDNIVIEHKIHKAPDFDYIVKDIQHYIKSYCKHTMSFTFNLFDKTIKIHFIVHRIVKEEIYRNIYRMIIWLYTVMQYTTQKCSNVLNVYVYLTSLKKNLPEEEHKTIGRINVNTGFTKTCAIEPESDIVIYRKEEWFKVFIHETFHNLGLDFSDISNHNTKQYILNIFKINSDVKLYEAYTDSWAKLLNVLISSYFLSDRTYEKYKSNVNMYINLEITNCFLQSIKILKYMGLSYKSLYDTSNGKKLYKEDTSIFAYYICNMIILNDYQDFIKWCYTNNINILQFDITSKKQIKFCEYIESKYKTNKLLTRIKCLSSLFDNYRENTDITKHMRKSLIQID